MERKISDLLDCIQDDSVQLRVADVASTERIKVLTVSRVHATDRRVTHIRKRIFLIAAAAACVVLLAVATMPQITAPETSKESTPVVASPEKTPNVVATYISMQSEEYPLTVGTELTLPAGSIDKETGALMSHYFGVTGENIESVTYSCVGGTVHWTDRLWLERLMTEAEQQGIAYEDIIFEVIPQRQQVNKSVNETRRTLENDAAKAYGVVGHKTFYCEKYMIAGSRIQLSITDADVFNYRAGMSYDILLKNAFSVAWFPSPSAYEELRETLRTSGDFTLLLADNIKIDVVFSDGEEQHYEISISFNSNGQIVALLNDVPV